MSAFTIIAIDEDEAELARREADTMERAERIAIALISDDELLDQGLENVNVLDDFGEVRFFCTVHRNPL